MLSIYSVRFDKTSEFGHEHLAVRLDFHQDEWNDRHKNDGFVLLVAHPDLPHSAHELVAIYRAKDAVEKDFQTIKTDFKLRPVCHHTALKVRAHVSLCMLALLLERTLERRLREASAPMTAPAVFEELAGVHLNMIGLGPDEAVTYVPAEPSLAQRDLLTRLRLAHLVDHEHIASGITPRPVW